MSTSNTIYIVIDPSGAKSGATATVKAMQTIQGEGEKVNVTVKNMTRNINSSSKSVESFFSKFSFGLKALGGMYALNQITGAFSSFVHEITRVDRVYNGFVAMLNTTTRDLAKTQVEFEYVAQTARAYGVSLEYLIRNYAKLRAATVHIMSEDETKRLFESFTAVSSVLHAEQITVERIYNAIIQIASKGQVHMEELKQQLGEHLPGALALAAQALDMTMAQMIEAMQKGEISARELLIPLPDILMERFAEAAEITSRSLHATFMNLRTSFFKAFKEMSTSGVALGLSEVLRAIQIHVDENSKSFKVFGEIVGHALLDLAAFIRSISPEAVAQFTTDMLKLIQATVTFTSQVFGLTVAMVEYKDEIWLAIQAWIAYKVVAGTVAAINTSIAASSALAASSLLLLRNGLLIAASAAAGWKFGDYLRETYLEAELAGIALASGIHKMVVGIGAMFEWLGEKIKHALVGGFQDAWRNFAIMQKHRFGSVPEDSIIKPFTDMLIPEIPDAYAGQDPGSLKAYMGDQLKVIQQGYDALADEAIKRSQEKVVPEGAVLDRLGLSEEQFKDAETLMQKYQSLKTEAEGVYDEQGHSKRGKVTAVQAATNEVNALMNRHKETVEQLKTLNAQATISTSQMIESQIASINNRTKAAVAVLEAAKLKADTPKEIEQLNGMIERYESERVRTVEKYQREEFEARKKFGEDLKDLENTLNKDRLTAVEEFLNEWNEKGEPLLIEARLNADTDSIARLESMKSSGQAEAEEKDKYGGTTLESTYSSIYEQLLKLTPEMTYLTKLGQEINRLYSETSGELIGLTARYDVLNDAYKRGGITQEYFQTELAKTNVAMAEQLNLLGYTGDKYKELELIGIQALGHITEGFTTVNHQIGEIMGQAFSDWVDGVSDSLAAAIIKGDDLGEALHNIATTILTEMLSALIKLGIQMMVNKVLGDVALAASTASQVSAAAASAAAWQPAATLASLASFGANAGPAIAGMTATAAAGKTISLTNSFEGGGYTGNDPRSGGLDGKGGFIAMLHPQETVIDHTKLAKRRPNMVDSMEEGRKVIDEPTTMAKNMANVNVQPAPAPQVDNNIRIVNAFDSSVIGDYLSTDAGEELIMNVVTKNESTVKSMLA